MSATKTKKHKLPVAPSEDAKPRGEIRYTAQQEAAYKEVVSQVWEKEASVKKGTLQMAYLRGRRAIEIKSQPELFGRRTDDQIAADFQVRSLTLRRSIQFNERITTDQLKELCAMKHPPAWRLMAKWAGIEDAAKRDEMLKEILAGNIDSTNFEGSYRRILSQGPVKPRCPADPSAMFRKIEAEAQTMTQQLTWIDDVDKKLSSITDAVKRRKAREVFKVTIQRLKECRGQLDDAISRGEALVSD